MCLLLRARSRWRSFVSCPGPLPWFAPRRTSRPLGIKARQSFAVRFGVPRGQRASRMLRHHRDRAPLRRLCRPGWLASPGDGGCLALASKSARRFSIRAMRGSLLRCLLEPLPPLAVQTTAGGALGGNPRTLGFCSPPLCQSAPRAANASKKPQARVLRSSLRPRWFLGLDRPLGPARRREMVSRRT